MPDEEMNDKLPHRIRAPLTIRLKPFAVAIGSTAAVTAGRQLLDPYLGQHDAYIPFLLSVIVTARLSGRKYSAFLALLLGVLAADFFSVDRRGSIGIDNVEQLVGLLVYLTVGSSCILLSADVARLSGEIAARQQAETYSKRLEQQLRQ